MGKGDIKSKKVKLATDLLVIAVSADLQVMTLPRQQLPIKQLRQKFQQQRNNSFN